MSSSSARSDFYMVNNLSIAVYALPKHSVWEERQMNSKALISTSCDTGQRSLMGQQDQIVQSENYCYSSKRLACIDGKK